MCSAARHRRRIVQTEWRSHHPSRLSAPIRLGHDGRVPQGSRHPGRRGGLERSICADDRDRRGARRCRGGAGLRARASRRDPILTVVGAADDHRARAARVRSRRRPASGQRAARRGSRPRPSGGGATRPARAGCMGRVRARRSGRARSANHGGRRSRPCSGSS